MGDTEKTWRGVTALSLIGEGSKSLPYLACCLEGKEDGISQSKRGSQEEEACGEEEEKEEEEEENIEIPPTTLRQGTSRGCYYFGGCWRIPDCGI